MKRVVVPMADGFEEIEAVVVIDILRRASLDVIAAGVENLSVTGSHGIKIECDCSIEDCDPGGSDAVVLPGGLPGATNLGQSEAVRRLIDAVNASGGLVGAICAAPTVLNDTGLLEGKMATSHPSAERSMDRCIYSTERVVVDGTLVTSRGAGTAVEFAAELVRLLAGADKADEILKTIVHK